MLPDGFTPNTNILSQTGNMLANPGAGKTQGNTGSIGFTYVRGSEDKAWTNQPTTIDGTNTVTLNVTGNTNVKGAVIDAKSAGLNINTGTFTYENIHDYDKSSSTNASVNLSFSLGGQKNGTWDNNSGGDQSQGGVIDTLQSLPGRYADALSGAWNALPGLAATQPGNNQSQSAGLSLAQIGQTLAQNPSKLQLGYKATDKEGVTFATVGQGNINVSDLSKQNALEKEGKTVLLGNLNRNVIKTQIITINRVDAFNAYISSDAIKTIHDVSAAIGQRILEIVQYGRVLTDQERQNIKKTEVIADMQSIHGCLSGTSSGTSGSSTFLFKLLFTPAYAANSARECVVIVYGANALLGTDKVVLSDAAVQQLAQDAADKTVGGIQDLIATINAYKARYPNSYSGDPAYEDLYTTLQTKLDLVRLCSTDDAWNTFLQSKNAAFLQLPEYASFKKVAEAAQLSAVQLVQKFGLTGQIDPDTVATLRAKYPAIYNQLVNHDFKDITQAQIDGIILAQGANTLNGADKSQAFRVAVDLLSPGFLKEGAWNAYQNFAQRNYKDALQNQQQLYKVDANQYVRDEIYTTLSPADLMEFRNNGIGNAILYNIGLGAWEGFWQPLQAFGRATIDRNYGKDQQVPLMDGTTNAPKVFTLTLDGQSINATGSCSSQNCPTVDGVQIWIDSDGQKNYYKDGQRIWTTDDTVNLLFAAAGPMAEGLNPGGAAKDITKMFTKPAAADAGSTLRTAAADAAIKDAESGAGSSLREPLANAESRVLHRSRKLHAPKIRPEPPVETGGATRAELPSKGEAPRTEIATDARPDVDPASQQGAISRTGTGLGNEAIAQADAAAAEQAVRDAELLTSRASGAATRADLNASGASAGSDVLKAAQNAEARALSETMSRIKTAAADQPARMPSL